MAMIQTHQYALVCDFCFRVSPTLTKISPHSRGDVRRILHNEIGWRTVKGEKEKDYMDRPTLDICNVCFGDKKHLVKKEIE